jgi:hypothetical protein
MSLAIGEFVYPPSLPGRNGGMGFVSVADILPKFHTEVSLDDKVVNEGDDSGLGSVLGLGIEGSGS